MNVPHSQLSTNLKHLRESMNLSRDALAEIVGSSSSHIGKLEFGTTKDPGWDVIKRLSRFFGVSDDELMEGTLIDVDQRKQALKRVYINFNDDQWVSVIDLVEGITRRQANDGNLRSL